MTNRNVIDNVTFAWHPIEAERIEGLTTQQFTLRYTTNDLNKLLPKKSTIVKVLIRPCQTRGEQI